MKGKEKIGTDLDEVVFKFVDIYDLFLSLEKHKVNPERFDRGVTDEQTRKELLVKLGKLGIFKIAPYHFGAREALIKLYQDFDLTIVTARDGYMKGKKDTLERLSKDCTPYDNIVFDSDKAKIVEREGLRFFVEDSLENAISIAEKTTCKVYLMNKLYNKYNQLPELKGQIIRVNNWEDCLQRVYRDRAIYSSLERELEHRINSQKLSHNISVDISSVIS